MHKAHAVGNPCDPSSFDDMYMTNAVLPSLPDSIERELELHLPP